MNGIMAELTELNSTAHRHLKVAPGGTVAFAEGQHLLNLRVVETGSAVCCFPVFVTRASNTGDWALSAVCSLQPGSNLFVIDGHWTALYRPTVMQTFPFYLMQTKENSSGYTVGIDETSPAFSTVDGEVLFEENGKASLYLSNITALLEADIRNDLQTQAFLKRLDELGLFKAVDMQVQLEDDSTQTIKGLHTINEDRLQALADEECLELNKRGYLAPVHALLVSIFQLNGLIRRYNQLAAGPAVRQIKLESARDISAAAEDF